MHIGFHDTAMYAYEWYVFTCRAWSKLNYLLSFHSGHLGSFSNIN